MPKIIALIFLLLLQAISAFASDFKLETVTVTAEKKETDVQKTPIPVSVISGTDTEDMNIRNLDDAVSYVPNFHIQSSQIAGHSGVTFRGLSANVYSGNNPVLLNIDGAPWELRGGFLSTLDDAERVEFLRGPQGTLYGKNAMGGVLNIITKRPGNEFSGKVSAGISERGGRRYSAAVSAPIIKDKLAIRVTGLHQERDGWMDATTPNGKVDMDKKKERNFSAKLLYTPTDKTDMLLSYSYYELDAFSSPIDFFKGSVSGPVFTEMDYKTHLGTDEYGDEKEIHRGVLNISHKFDKFTMTSITSYAESYEDHFTPQQQLSKYGGVQEAEDSIISQELRFASPEDSKISWVGGFYLDKSKLNKKHMSVDIDFSMFGMGVTTVDWPATEKIYTKSLFAEATFPVVNKLKLKLGGRYEHLKKSIDYTHVAHDYHSGAALPTDYTGATLPLEYFREDTWSKFLGKAVLSYDVTDKNLLYLSVSQGYMPGGYNYTEDDKGKVRFDETESVDYQLGMKNKFLDDRLMLNANIFYNEYKDLQTVARPTPLTFHVISAGKAHAQGFELDMALKPFPGFSLFGSFGYIKAVYDDFLDQGVKHDGNSMIETPKHTSNLRAVYRAKSGIFAMADLHHTGKTYFSKDNDSKYTRDAFSIVNAKVGYESEKGFEIYLYGKNLTDKEYATGIFSFGQTPAEPRTFGAEAVFRF